VKASNPKAAAVGALNIWLIKANCWQRRVPTPAVSEESKLLAEIRAKCWLKGVQALRARRKEPDL